MRKYILTPTLFLWIIGLLIACSPHSDEQVVQKAGEKKEETDGKENPKIAKYEFQEEDWELSPTFEHSVVYKGGDEGVYTLVGNKEEIGFTGPFPILAKETQKYFWFYFGKTDIYDKPVKVVAIKKGTQELVDILSSPSTFYKSAEVSPGSVNMPSHLKFPSAGKWRILIYIDEKLYDSIVVEVV